MSARIYQQDFPIQPERQKQASRPLNVCHLKAEEHPQPVTAHHQGVTAGLEAGETGKFTPGAHRELPREEVHDTHADHAFLHIEAEVEVVGQHVAQAALDVEVLRLDGRLAPENAR